MPFLVAMPGATTGMEICLPLKSLEYTATLWAFGMSIALKDRASKAAEGSARVQLKKSGEHLLLNFCSLKSTDRLFNLALGAKMPSKGVVCFMARAWTAPSSSRRIRQVGAYRCLRDSLLRNLSLGLSKETSKLG